MSRNPNVLDPIPVQTPFFEEDKAQIPPKIPVKPWIDAFRSWRTAIAYVIDIIDNGGLEGLPANETTIGTLTAVADTVVHTVALARTTRLTANFNNTGASDRLVNVSVTKDGVTKRVATGETTNSPTKAGTSLGVDFRIRLEVGDTVNAWQDSGADVDFEVTCEGEE